jgi:hypothetical protein
MVAASINWGAAPMAIEDLTVIGDVLYERRSDGMLYPVRRIGSPGLLDVGVMTPPRADAPQSTSTGPAYSFGDVGRGVGNEDLSAAYGLLSNAANVGTYDPIVAASRYAGNMGMAGLLGAIGAGKKVGGYAADALGAGYEALGGDRFAKGGAAEAMYRDMSAGMQAAGVGPEARMLEVLSSAGAGRSAVDAADLTAREALAYARSVGEGDLAFLRSGGVPQSLGAAGVPVPSINRIDPNEWRQRLEASLPASWLDPKFDKPQWHGISNVASELPLSDMQPVLRSTGTLQPEVGKTIESLVGRTGIPALGDRSIAGSEILGVGNLTYRNPVRSLGGADFMRESGTGIWANAAPQAEDLARTADQVIRAGGDPALIFTAMGPQSADFSTMMAESVMNQYDPRMIDPNLATRYDDAVRKFVPGFTSIMNPNFLAGLTGTDRWNLWQLMDKAELRRAGFPDINLARRGITDPRLMDVVPFDAGLTIGRPTGGLLSPSNTIIPHPTYPSQLAGAYEGGLERSIPGAILWRDFFKQRRASGASPGADQRSFLMNANKIAQRIDQQTVDEANQFFETLRGLNDPTSPMRIWRGLLDG